MFVGVVVSEIVSEDSDVPEGIFNEEDYETYVSSVYQAPSWEMDSVSTENRHVSTSPESSVCDELDMNFEGEPCMMVIQAGPKLENNSWSGSEELLSEEMDPEGPDGISYLADTESTPKERTYNPLHWQGALL